MATHGTFYWNELMTRDVAAAKTFYTDLLGWTTEDMETPMGPYTLFKAEGHDGYVGGAMQMNEEMGDTPSYWGSYVAVDDVDAVLARVEALGGTILHPAMEAEGVGRMAFIQDPTGAQIALMTPAEVNEPA